MLLKTLVYKKKDLTTVTETSTLEEALKILETSGYRCVPILDSSGIFSVEIFTKCTSIVIKQTAVI